MATISTHNGSAVHRSHNIRDKKTIKAEKDQHIDLSLPHEIWHDESEKDAYNRLFGPSQFLYNQKQSDPRRQIKDYYQKIAKDKKKHTSYEMIIGVYGSDASDPEIKKQIYHEFLDGWSKRNPNLELIGAYYHADEPGAGDHLHIDYIPVATGYKRGMETQTSLSRALAQQGYQTKGQLTAQIQWEATENLILEHICNTYGISVDHPQKGKGVAHRETEIYKLDDQICDLERQKADLSDYVNQLDKYTTKKQNDVYEATVDAVIAHKVRTDPKYHDLLHECDGIIRRYMTFRQKVNNIPNVIYDKIQSIIDATQKYSDLQKAKSQKSKDDDFNR